MQEEQYQTQFNEGFKAGIEEAAELINSVAQLERHFFENWNQFKISFEQEVAKIVLAAVGKILGQALARPEAAMAAVKEVLQSAGYENQLTVYVSANDFRMFERYRTQISTHHAIEYVADERVAIGGCLVKLDKGMLDGRIEVQLQALVDTLSAISRG
jgi:flagellar biosynthesis/type III secretory pathway protein FliH